MDPDGPHKGPETSKPSNAEASDETQLHHHASGNSSSSLFRYPMPSISSNIVSSSSTSSLALAGRTWTGADATSNPELHSTESTPSGRSCSSDGDGRNLTEPSSATTGVSSPAVRTLFISGLPADVKSREIFNLLRFLPGFVDCSLKTNNNGKQGIRFDPYGSPCYLRIQFARVDSKVKRSLSKEGSLQVSQTSYQGDFPRASSSNFNLPNLEGGSVSPLGSSNSPLERGSSPNLRRRHQTPRIRNTPDSLPRGGFPSASSDHLGTSGSTSSGRYAILLEPSQDRGNLNMRLRHSKSGSRSPRQTGNAAVATHPYSRPSSSSPTTEKTKSQPCSTLFIANLSMQTSEDDLRQTFGRALGFRRLQFQMSGDGLPICYVDFNSEENSTKLMNQYQGSSLHQSPIRIEYARERMNRHKFGQRYKLQGMNDDQEPA